MQLNPRNPTRAMAKASSIPVRKRIRTTASPRSPIVTSLIGAPYYLKDVRDEDEALNETADADSVSHRIEGQLQRQRNLSRAQKIHPQLDHIPPEQEEERDAHESGHHVDGVPHPFRELENK